MQNRLDATRGADLSIPARAVSGAVSTLDCGSRSSLRWYCIQHQPARGETAALELIRQGFEVWHPLRPATVRHARKVTQVLRPVFPGYIFVRFDVQRDRWRCIVSTRGVHRLFYSSPETPWPVRPGIIEALQAEQAAAGSLDRPADSLIRAGATVRINPGSPMGDQMGPVLRVDGGKVTVEVALFGRPIRVRVPVTDLELITPAPAFAHPAAA
jgi:transcriptional antiterminator RfaH